jgi:plasmid stabilization system protein ParE
MPASYQFTPQASEDLEAIWSYISQDSMDAANRVETAILEACTLVAQNPSIGSRRIEITARPLRFWTVPRFSNYIIVYLPETIPLQIVAVLHGKRQNAALLQRLENR